MYFINPAKFLAIIFSNIVLFHFLYFSQMLIEGMLNCLIVSFLLFIFILFNAFMNNVLRYIFRVVNSFSSCV